jgi:ATP-dependent Clp protease ATP-binding subunit ClpB
MDDDYIEAPIFKLLDGLYDYEFLEMEKDLEEDEEVEFDDFFDLENEEEEKKLDNQIFSQELIDKYKFIDRIKYGLPITKEEYISIEFTKNINNYVIDNSFSLEYGARPVKRFIQREIETLLAKAIIRGDIDKNRIYTVDCINNEIVIK